LDSIAASASTTINFNAQGLSNTAWSCAMLQFGHNILLDSIGIPPLVRAFSFTEQNLSNTAWAFSKLAILYAPLLDATSAAALARISEFFP